MELNIPQKPCLVQTERGFSVSYKDRFLYSKYAPSRAIEGAIQNLSLLPGTLILAFSPALWLCLDKLLEKLPQDCFILGIECDKALHDFAAQELKKLESDFLTESPNNAQKSFALLPFEQNDSIVNVLSGEGNFKGFQIPHISTFRRAIPIEMSAGTQFSREKYFKIAGLAQNTIASFWKNRITLTKLGRLYSRNLFKNLAKLPDSLDLKNLAHTIKQPIFVFGAGESIEDTISNISVTLLKKCFLISVDAATPALQEYGLHADAIIAVEGQLAIEKAYIGSGSKKSLIIADMSSRTQVTRHSDFNPAYFASKYTDASFFTRLSQMDFFPPVIPPLGSVGLTAVYAALLLRENQNVPVFFSGLDFSFSSGRTHAKNTPAHIARLCSTNKFNPVENYAASFRNGAKRVQGKNKIEIFTDAALESYSKSFTDSFFGVPNVYDAGKQGLPLGMAEISSEKVRAYLGTVNSHSKDESKFLTQKNAEKRNAIKESIRIYLENEEKALNRIKELLMFGSDVADCSCSPEVELHELIAPREYLFLHFPDGYKCQTDDLSFLKRVRGQIDFFLKDIKNALHGCSEKTLK